MYIRIYLHTYAPHSPPLGLVLHVSQASINTRVVPYTLILQHMIDCYVYKYTCNPHIHSYTFSYISDQVYFMCNCSCKISYNLQALKLEHNIYMSLLSPYLIYVHATILIVTLLISSIEHSYII